MSVTTTNHETVDEMTSAIERGAERVGDAVSTFNDQAQRFVRARPGTVLLVALALGFGVGWLVSRR